MNPRDFLQIAKDLLKIDKPANCRTVFNRSYYAVYNVAVDLLEAAHVAVTRSAEGHEEVKRYLNNCGIQELKEAQQKIVNLSTNRIRADYRLNEKYVEKIENAEMAVRRAEDIINIFDSHSSKSERGKIAKAVNEYKSKIEFASKAP
ncbi:MAG: HEPN domain-containing protein [Deltaproteobacteria bacterium]|nr:HEPN domain-containing protein [Deltaproteobacteria bacterium]